MNTEYIIRSTKLKALSAQQNGIALEGMSIFKTNDSLMAKLSSFASGVSNFFKDNIAVGLLPNITYTSSDSKVVKELKRTFEEYDYMSLRNDKYLAPVGINVTLNEYINFISKYVDKTQQYIIKDTAMLNGVVADLLKRPEKFAGSKLLPVIGKYDLVDFQKDLKKVLNNSPDNKQKWGKLVKRNSDYVTFVEDLTAVVNSPLIDDYPAYLDIVRSTISKVDSLITEIKSKDTNIELSPRNITKLSEYILASAQAAEAFGLLTTFVNDLVIITDKNNEQLTKMR